MILIMGRLQQQHGKTLAKVTGFSFLPGDTIKFKRGETWVGYLRSASSGTTNKYITFTDYGSGALPIISSDTTAGLQPRNGVAWQKYENLQLQNTSGVINVQLYNTVSNIWFNNITSVGNKYFLQGTTGVFTNITITNITTSGASHGYDCIQFATCDVNGLIIDNVQQSDAINGVQITPTTYATNITIKNSTFNSNTGRGIRITLSSNVLINYVTTPANSLGGIFVYDNSGALTISNSICNTNGGGGLLFSNVSNAIIDTVTANSNVAVPGFNLYGNLSNILIKNSITNLNGQSGITLRASATFVHSSITIQDHTSLTNDYHGFELNAISGNGDGVLLLRCTGTTNKIDGFNIHGPYLNVIHDYCTADTNGVNGLGADGDGFSYHETSTGIIRNCIAKYNKKTAIANIDSSSTYIHNNRLYHTTTGTLGMVYLSGSGVHRIEHNSIYSDGVLGNGIQIVQDAPTVSIIKNNIVQGFDKGILLTTGLPAESYNDVYGAATANFSGLVPGLNSIQLDPKFTNPATRDFTLQVTSPCLNAGDDSTNMGAL
jgi:hypothetical protein